MQRDPLGLAAGPNLYDYCGGNPVDMYDPMGLWWEETATQWANSDNSVQQVAGWAIGLAGGFAEGWYDGLTMAANKAVGFQRTLMGYTRHHNQDLGLMQL